MRVYDWQEAERRYLETREHDRPVAVKVARLATTTLEDAWDWWLWFGRLMPHAVIPTA